MSCKYCARYENTLRKQSTMEAWSEVYHRFQEHQAKYGCTMIEEKIELADEALRS